MNIFISGGCKNGKSLHAQVLARDMAEGTGAPLYYIATMIPKDDEDRARIRKHLEARAGWGFTTVEIDYDLMRMISPGNPGNTEGPEKARTTGDPAKAGATDDFTKAGDAGAGGVTGAGEGEDLILDENGKEIDPNGVFLMDSVTALLSNVMFKADGTYDPDAGEKVKDDLVAFADVTGNTVFVSDYIYSDARMYDDWTENYRRSLAMCDRALAEVCDKVIEVSFGTFRTVKG